MIEKNMTRNDIYMKQINTYINEKLRLTAKYTCQPKDKGELRQIILQRIKDEGNECDLNDIDTSKITDMESLFDAYTNKIFKDFNGNISQWNVSNVKCMKFMFNKCEKFNGDISMWNVSNVEDMSCMFCECKKFDCDLSKWNVSKAYNMGWMFYMCYNFNCDISEWNVSNVETICWMFNKCNGFNQDLDSWDVSNVENMLCAFKDCPTKPTWYERKKWE